MTVSSESGTQVLDQPNQYTEVSSKSSSPSAPAVMEKEKIDADFSDVIAALPLRPVSFLLYFKFGTSDLTKESEEMLPEIMDTIRAREVCTVSIIGHSDTMGPEEYNIKLSYQRAKMINDLLVDKGGVTCDKMTVSSHGENDQLVKTGDDVSMPKNRRVEIMVK